MGLPNSSTAPPGTRLELRHLTSKLGESGVDAAEAAGLGVADDVEHRDARVDVEELLRRPARRTDAEVVVLVDEQGPEAEQHDRAERQRQHRDVAQHRGGLRPLEERGEEEADGAERHRRGQQDELLAHDVVDGGAAVHEHDGRDRYRRHDHQHHEGEGGEELADDDGPRTHRRAHQQVQRLLLALEADLAGREAGGDEADEDELEDREQREDRLADDGRGVGLVHEAVAAEVVAGGRGNDEVRAVRDERQQAEVDGEHDERASSSHPRAKLLDHDRADPREELAERRPTRGTHHLRRRRHAAVRSFVLAGDLEEDLLEVAGRLSEADHAMPGLDHRSQQDGLVVAGAVEGDLQARRAVRALRGQDVADARIGSEPVRRRADRVGVAEKVDAQQRSGPQRPLDLGDAPGAQDAAVVDDRDPGAHLAELGEDVAADEDRLAHRPQLAKDLAHLDAGPRVEARGRLVEDQQRRIVDERVGEAQPLAHAAREGLDVGVALVGEADDLEQLADHRGPAGRGDAVAAREEVEVLPDAEVVVHAVEVGHVADAAADLDRVRADRDAGHERLARGRGEERGQDLHRRRLARAVRPDQPEDLAAADDEVDAGHGEVVVVALHEAAGLDHRDADHRSSTPLTCALG